MNDFPWITVTAVVSGIAVVIVGAIVTISGGITFEEYVTAVSIFGGIAGGGAAVGRGIAAAAKK